MSQHTDDSQPAEPKWQPLSPRQRRIIGVLVEKAKTTPQGYPMSANAIMVASNQKSNRKPQMSLNEDEVQEAVDQLREKGAIGVIEGNGRVSKVRHYLYEWLGTDKKELAIMAELLLRGEQTVGELRARASRMEPIAGLNELQPILQSLIEKKLVISLTPPGRGQVVTHGLYREQELQQVLGQYQQAGVVSGAESPDPAPIHSPTTTTSATAAPGNDVRRLSDELREVQRELQSLKERVQALEQAGSVGDSTH